MECWSIPTLLQRPRLHQGRSSRPQPAPTSWDPQAQGLSGRSEGLRHILHPAPKWLLRKLGPNVWATWLPPLVLTWVLLFLAGRGRPQALNPQAGWEGGTGTRQRLGIEGVAPRPEAPWTPGMPGAWGCPFMEGLHTGHRQTHVDRWKELCCHHTASSLHLTRWAGPQKIRRQNQRGEGCTWCKYVTGVCKLTCTRQGQTQVTCHIRGRRPADRRGRGRKAGRAKAGDKSHGHTPSSRVTSASRS